MPAGSEPSPPRVPVLPHTFRPRGVRIAFYLLGLALGLISVAMWFAFPPEIRAKFTFFQIVTILALGGMFYAAGFALARSRVVVREDGLTVVNGYKVRRMGYGEVVAVSLRSGSPWAMLDLADGSTVPAMGIQGSDGARAVTQAKQLRRLVAERG